MWFACCLLHTRVHRHTLGLVHTVTERSPRRKAAGKKPVKATFLHARLTLMQSVGENITLLEKTAEKGGKGVVSLGYHTIDTPQLYTVK